MYRVLITGAIHQKGIDLLQQEPDLEVDFHPDLPLQEVLDIIEPYHCIITRSETPIQKELIDKAINLKVIARAAVGVANIDVDYATEKGILVINTPGKNTNSAAELTIALLLDVTRKVTLAHQNMKEGRWERHKFKGSELLGKTLGIIGLGNVGHRVARFALSFEMKVIAYDPHITDEVFERNQVKKVTWDTLLHQADVVSVHTPKNRETIDMIGAEEIAMMKPGVVVINAARGGIINEAALLEAVKSGHVGGVGVDTWNVEPPIDNPFIHFPQVVMTPHIGASTSEAQLRITETVADQVPRALRGDIVDSPVNMPQVEIMGDNLMVCYGTLSERIGSFAAQYMDFTPAYLEIKYRGTLAQQNCSLLRLALLKGLFKGTREVVNYVNADQIAESEGLHITEIEDSGFTDYDNAIRCRLTGKNGALNIGGAVFSGSHLRLTLVDDFVFELAPEGIILVTKNEDYPGIVGIMGSILGKNKINIAQFELSRNRKGGDAMSLIQVDDDVPESVIQELKAQEGITMAKKIVIK